MRYHMALAAFIFSCVAAWPGMPASREAFAAFSRPGREFSTGPLWVWNDMITTNMVRDTLQDLASQKVKQGWVHPRPGLMTPYLSREWFNLWKETLRQAERLDMNVWIYDENSYPSGFAGGFVPDQMPDARGRGLAFRQQKNPQWSEATIAIYDTAGGGCRNVSSEVRSGAALPEGSYLEAYEKRSEQSPWYAGKSYVNLLSPGVTEKFLEVTHQAYLREVGSEFGKRVPGIFTDEPNIRPAGGTLPWSEILADEFRKRWGYDLIENLPSLRSATGDWRKVRHNYYQLLNEQFIEHWARPTFDWCEKNNLEWTGHYWDHEWPECSGVPDNMAMYAWHQRPAIDCLMNRYSEGTHAQFGNVRMVRELASVANQLGMQRTLCEIYGAGGWDLRFEDMKRIGDWLAVLGVNTFNEHLSYVSIRGARKRDHPQSFSYHEPWWRAYNQNAEYLTRLSAALSQGEQINRVLVLEPTTTAWMYQGDGAALERIGTAFTSFLHALEAAQVEYDIASEDILERHGGTGQPLNTQDPQAKPALRIGKRDYALLIMPVGTENLNSATVKLLQIVGTPILYCGHPPTFVDGKEAPNALPIAPESIIPEQGIPQLIEELQIAQAEEGFGIDRAAGDRGNLFHMRRRLANGELLFLVNTSLEHSSSGMVLSTNRYAEEWDPHTGQAKPVPLTRQKDSLAMSYELPPCGSLLVLLNNSILVPGKMKNEAVAEIEPIEPLQVRGVGPNVLTLDYVSVTAGNRSLTNVYYQVAAKMIWQNAGLPGNPWDSGVQFQDELIRKTFPKGSGFETSYSFTIEGPVPRDLQIVIERPDLYSINCNGRAVKAPPGQWWLDKSFGKIDLSRAARTGENRVTLAASQFSVYHELEPAYLLGNFSLEAASKGFIVKPPVPLQILPPQKVELRHSNNPDGAAWLSAGVGFGPQDDRAPWIIFDLGEQTDISAVDIWNYSEGNIRDLSHRGVRRVRITASPSPEMPPGPGKMSGVFNLKKGEGLAERVPFEAKGVRFVRIDVLSNQKGTVFPFEGAVEGRNEIGVDNALVGLDEVQFVRAGAGDPGYVQGLSIHSKSSELTSHNRKASYLVDGSGFAFPRRGWDVQGAPFYSEGVSHKLTYNISPKFGARYFVQLPDWLGSVAEVKVGGRNAGWIYYAPYKCEITKAIRSGRTEVEVIVIGTLRNTLGPHHGNPPLGSTWPSDFRKAPENGPPPGASYSTVSYGLFEPFRVLEVSTLKAAAVSANMPEDSGAR